MNICMPLLGEGSFALYFFRFSLCVVRFALCAFIKCQDLTPEVGVNARMQA
jgi:hypothetical protein